MFALPAGILGSGFVEVTQEHIAQDDEKGQEKIRIKLDAIDDRLARVESQLEVLVSAMSSSLAQSDNDV